MTTLAEQIAALESRLAAYESRKVPLSGHEAEMAYCSVSSIDKQDRLIAVARAALVAAESPDAVKAAIKAWCGAKSTEINPMLAAIRAAHDAAIDGGCGAARGSDGPPWLADAAKALGKVAPDGTAFALNWSQVIRETRELRHRFDTEVEHHKLTAADRDEWLAEAKRLEKERDDLRRQLDALTRPIEGVEELGRIGWEAWIGVQGAVRDEDKIHADERCAKAIASRVIGALRSSLIGVICGECHSEEFAKSSLINFDAAVASLKIEPAKVEATPKREPFELPHYGLSFGVDDCVAIRDRIREIERRLEAGGL